MQNISNKVPETQRSTSGVEIQSNHNLQRLETRQHILDLDDFSVDDLRDVLEVTVAMKEILTREVKKVPTLRGKTIMTLFLEPSTRTRVSFETAGKMLSADVINLSSNDSSIEKGESFLDTILTLQATGADVLVLRHADSGAPYFAARNLSCVSVINAGDGSHAHPTQALLDLFTMQSHLKNLEGRRVVIVGDISHSRVARSNMWGLTKLGANVVLSGPSTLIPWDLLNGRNETLGHPFSGVEVEMDLDKALRDADVVMALRVQKERQMVGSFPSMREYMRYWQINEERLAKAKPSTYVMHPGPVNEGVELSPGIAYGQKTLIQEQVTNGVAVRMALLVRLMTSKEK